MASDQAAPVTQDRPLSFMQALGPTVAYHEPLVSAAASVDGPPGDGTQGHDPKLIVMLAWMSARDIHIAKYITQYRALFPSSRILLVRCPASHAILPFLSTPGLKTAVAVIRSALDGHPAQIGDVDHSRVIMHVFSNGGMSTAARLYKMLDEVASVPRHVLLLDSCPGYFHYRSTYAAIKQGVPWLMAPLMHLVIALAWLVRAPRRRLPPPDENARAINVDRLVQRQPRRTYLYGNADPMVDWRDVEDHAARARSRGFVVRTEMFHGGKHVAHVRIDPDRYWRAVKETWEHGRV